jgi:hypothetical protein
VSQYGAVPEINGAQAQAKSAYGSLVSDDELKASGAAASASESAARVASPPAGGAEEVDDWIELTHAASGRKYYQSVRKNEKKNYLEEKKKKIFLSPYSLSAFLFFFSPRKSKLKQTTWVKPAHFKPGRIRPAPAKSTSPPPTQPSQPLAAPQRSSYMALPGGPSPTPPAAAAAPQPQVPPQRSSYMALPGGPSPTPPAAAPSGPGAPARRSSYLALPGGPGPAPTPGAPLANEFRPTFTPPSAMPPARAGPPPSGHAGRKQMSYTSLPPEPSAAATARTSASENYGVLELLPQDAPDAPPPFMSDAGDRVTSPEPVQAQQPPPSPQQQQQQPPPTRTAGGQALPARPGGSALYGARAGRLQQPPGPAIGGQPRAAPPRVLSPGLDVPASPATPLSPQLAPASAMRGGGGGGGAAAGGSRLVRKDRIENISKALHHGFLFKKGKKRWFVLRGGVLYWFVDERPVHECTQEFLEKFCCNKLDLSQYNLFEAEMRITDLTAGVEQTAFTLEPLEIGSGKRLKSYQLRAPTSNEWRLWMDKIDAALQSMAKAAANTNALLIEAQKDRERLQQQQQQQQHAQQNGGIGSGTSSFRKSSGASHVCTVAGCGKEYFSEQELATHVLERHAHKDQSATFSVQPDTMIYRCPVCQKAYITERDLNTHHKLRHGSDLRSGAVKPTRANDDASAFNGTAAFGGSGAAPASGDVAPVDDFDNMMPPSPMPPQHAPGAVGGAVGGGGGGDADAFGGDERRHFAFNVDLRQFRWYHGNLSAAVAYKRLTLVGRKNSYLVRTGSRNSGFVISWISEEAPISIIHSVVNELDGGVWQMTGDATVYSSFAALMEGFAHTMRHPVFS